MPRRRFLAVVVAGALCIVALVLWVYPSSTDFAISNTHWNGTSDLNHEFHLRGLTDEGGLPAVSRGAVLFVIPTRTLQPPHRQAIKRFVDSGGVLILLGGGGLGNEVLMALGSTIRFSGQQLADPLFNLKSRRLPKIVDFAPSPLTAGVDGLVFNHATVLTGISPAQAVARSSPVSYLASTFSGQRDTGVSRGPFPVLALEPVKDGYMVAVSDSSLVINSMLAQADNRRLLRNAVGLAGPNARIFLYDTLLPQGPLDVAQALLADIRRLINGPVAAFALVIAALILPAALLSKTREEATS